MSESTERQTLTPESHNEESHPAWWNPRSWRAEIWMLVIGGLLLALPFGVRAVMLSGVPVIPDPFDVDDFSRWDVSPDDDAFTYFRKANDLRARIVADLRSKSLNDPLNVDNVIEKGWAEADEPLKQWMELHREALALWRRGADKNSGLDHSPATQWFDSPLTIVIEQRLFARLAMLEAVRCIHNGHSNDAWQWLRAALRSGGHVSYRGCMVQGRVGSVIHNTSTTGMSRWAEQPGLTSDQLKSALTDVRSCYSLYESPSNLLKAEYLAAQNTLRNPSWIDFTDTPDSPGIAAVAKMGYWVIGEPEISSRLFRQVLANQIREIDKPIAIRRKAVGLGVALMFDPDPSLPLLPGQFGPTAIDQGIQRSIVIRGLMPDIKAFDAALQRQVARQAAIEVVLAAQAYRRDHGEFPLNLSLLVPAYLSSVPLDPCDASGGPLLYRRDEVQKAVVWSVGDDGSDGGGNVVAPANARPADVGFELK